MTTASADFVYGFRPFILCSLPYRKPAHPLQPWVRRNGATEVRILPHPNYGLPYGQDRLIALLAATLAVIQNSRVIEIGSHYGTLGMFGLGLNGRNYARWEERWQRVAGATIETVDFPDEHRPFPVMRRFRLFDSVRLWFEDEKRHRRFDNRVTLSQEFWRELCAHPVPAPLAAVRKLASSPSHLDFYLWLKMCCPTIHTGRFARFPLHGAKGLARHLGTSPDMPAREFRRSVDEWLETARTVWPACPAMFSTDRKELLLWRLPAVHSKLAKPFLEATRRAQYVGVAAGG